MTSDEPRDDETLRALRAAVLPDVGRPRAEVIRERCRQSLRRRAGRTPEAVLAQCPWHVVEPVLVSAMCAVYLWEIARRAAWLFGL